MVFECCRERRAAGRIGWTALEWSGHRKCRSAWLCTWLLYVGSGPGLLDGGVERPVRGLWRILMRYDIHTDVKFKPLELVDAGRLADECQETWWNQTLTKVNDAVVRLGVFQAGGEFHWHKHDLEDEFFYVVEGRLLVDLENRTVELRARQGVTVPRGVVHRTRAPERTVVLMVEAAGVVATGD
jgi:mannose-6-phosphate isomerase-like protein (cupin superfamily)